MPATWAYRDASDTSTPALPVTRLPVQGNEARVGKLVTVIIEDTCYRILRCEGGFAVNSVAAPLFWPCPESSADRCGESHAAAALVP
jgi:hypothetical protein